MIYLACPYSHPDPAVCQQQFEAANRAAAALLGRGFVVFSPISQNHPIAEQEGLPTGWEFWEKFDREFIQACTALYVLKIDGWHTSVGVLAEITLASTLGKPVVFFLDPDNPLPPD